MDKIEEIKENASFNGSVYFVDDDDYPICPLCLESENIAVHVYYHVPGAAWRCRRCDKGFYQHYNDVPEVCRPKIR